MGLIPKEPVLVDFPYQTTIMDGGKPGLFSICASGLSICSGWIITFSAPRLLDPVDTSWTKTNRIMGWVTHLSCQERKEICGHLKSAGIFCDVLKLQLILQFGVCQFDGYGWNTNKFGPQEWTWKTIQLAQNGCITSTFCSLVVHVLESCFECPFSDITYMDIIWYKNQYIMFLIQYFHAYMCI